MIIQNTNHKTIFDWQNVSIQGGETGIVFSFENSYTTAFVEVFSKGFDIFVRGEGKTIQEAEASAWEQYQSIINCSSHEFEKRGYTNGLGFCKKCNYSKQDAFEPSEKCFICDTNTFWKSDIDGVFYCKEHCHLIPKEKIKRNALLDFLKNKK